MILRKYGLGAFLLCLCVGAVVSTCGNSDPQSFTATFRATDSVTTSIFTASSKALAAAGDFRLTVVSSGVSSGFVKLNENELLGPSDFHNTSFQETMTVALQDENTIEVEVRGSPGDQLCVRFYEVLVDPPSERGIFEGCVDRTAGPPNNVTVVITATPTPTPSAP